MGRRRRIEKGGELPGLEVCNLSSSELYVFIISYLEVDIAVDSFCVVS